MSRRISLTSERQEQHMNEIYGTVSDEEFVRIINETAHRYAGTLKLLSEWRCENGECPECAAKQARGYPLP